MTLANMQTRRVETRPYFKTAVFRIATVVTIALSSFLLLASCGDSATERADEVGGVTAGQIIENPAAYVGKTVTVTGQVEEIFGPRAFNMDSGLSVGELLVIGRDPYPQVPEASNRAYVVSDLATVTGTVRLFVAADIEREIGWDLDPEIEVEFNSKPVLIVRNVSFRPNPNRSDAQDTDTVQTGANNNMGQTPANTNTSETTSANKITDASVYASTSDKLSLVGREAQLANARVARVVGPRTFTVASGDSEIYVMLSEESARGVGTQGKIGVGTTLSLTGRFERLEAAEIEQLSDNRFRTLTDTERKFLKNTSVYLQAGEVSDLK